jgi:hypothetical protein
MSSLCLPYCCGLSNTMTALLESLHTTRGDFPMLYMTHAGAGSWKASTSDNGNGTYAVTFKVDRAGPWVILPKCVPTTSLTYAC